MAPGPLADVWVAMVDMDVAQVERVRAAVERSTVTVSSADHAVLVTVGPGGALAELDLTHQAVRHGGHALAGLITDTIARATAELDATLAATLGELTGGRADPAALLAGTLPAPPSAAPTAPPTASRPVGTARAEEAIPGGELVDRLRAESARTLDGYAGLREELAEMATTVRSPDGAVAVTVRSGGRIADLRIDDAALRHGPGNLGRLVLTTIHRARAASALRAAERVRELAGPALSIRDMVAAAIPPEFRPDDDTDDRAAGGRR